MSLTSTIGPREQQNHVSGTILLSPSQKRISNPEVKNEASSKPTTTEIWRWTFTRDAIALCFIDDIFQMEENKGKEADFYWLGRVPCRTVKIVGLLVGVQVYEKKIQYSVDDGTAVIDCRQTHRQTPPHPRGTVSSHPNYAPLPHILPKALGPVGTAVIVTGRVVTKYETREIIVSSIEKCASSNEELAHWQIVCMLHRSSYFSPEPFRIPPTVTPIAPPSKQIPVAAGSCQTVPITLTDISATPASSAASSPVKAEKLQSSPPKLRHPSRLSSRHLTDITFQKYMMHYIHHTATSPPSVDEDSDTEAISYSLSKVPSTPTKSSQLRYLDATPRPGSSRLVGSNPQLTPNLPLGKLKLTQDQPPQFRGFTLSHLRRVPELADMARRVVKAEAKRRSRQEKRKIDNASETHARSRNTQVASQPRAKENIAPRVKRLFQFAAVQLLREGSIVLWDGPVHPLPNSFTCANSLWKADSTSNSTLGPDNTVFSSTSGTQPEDPNSGNEVELSDPGDHEEAYYPLTPTFLASNVEKTIRRLGNTSTSKNGHAHPNRGFTTDDILKYLRKDDRWRYAGDWHVNDALEVLRMEGRAWCVGKGKWELTV